MLEALACTPMFRSTADRVWRRWPCLLWRLSLIISGGIVVLAFHLGRQRGCISQDDGKTTDWNWSLRRFLPVQRLRTWTPSSGSKPERCHPIGESHMEKSLLADFRHIYVVCILHWWFRRMQAHVSSQRLMLLKWVWFGSCQRRREISIVHLLNFPWGAQTFAC